MCLFVLLFLKSWSLNEIALTQRVHMKANNCPGFVLV